MIQETSLLTVIDLNIWNSELIILYGNDTKWLKKQLKKSVVKKKYKKAVKTIDLSNNTYKGRFLSYYPMYIIHIPHQSDIPSLLGIISHEALHATIEILNNKGLILNTESEEAYTYTLQYIVEHTTKALISE